MPELMHTAAQQVTLAPVTIGWAWNVQGARADSVAERLFGVALPHAANTVTRSADAAALWLGPDSWLLLGATAPPHDYAPVRDALNAAGAALFDVSASRVAFALSGPRAVDVLAAGCPLDFHVRAFAPGSCAQSVLSRVNALFVRPRADVFVVLVARSFGRDVWHGLRADAREYGYTVEPVLAWPAL